MATDAALVEAISHAIHQASTTATTRVADFFMRGRIVGMGLLIQGVFLLARAGEGSGRHAGFWPVIVAAIVIMTLCWFGLSVMSQGKKLRCGKTRIQK